MSAPLLGATTSASGFEDGFGRRQIAFARDDGAASERLHLRPEFSIYERALRDSFARMAAGSPATAGGRIVAPGVLERDRATGELVAVSAFVGGERLIDLLDAAAERARDDAAVPGIDAALGFLIEVLPALSALRAATGMSHGAIAPSRCVFTAEGRVILTECGFAAVLQRLNVNRRRLWREFRVAAPPGPGPARFDETGDISQAAVAAVMLVVGRPMTDDDAADALPEWLADVVEIAQIRGSVSFAVNLQRFLQRALPLPGRRPYMTVDDALQDVGPLAASIGVDLCRAAIAESVRHATMGQGAEPIFAAVPAPPVAPVSVYQFDDLELPEPVEWIPLHIAAEPVVDEAETLLLKPVAAEPVREPFIEAPVAAASEPIAQPQPAPPALETRTPEPIDQAVIARRRRARSKRHWVDALRSAVTRATAPEPQPEPAAAVEAIPVVPAPMVVPPAVVAQPVAPEPLASQASAPGPVVSQPFMPAVVPPLVAQPVAAAPVLSLPLPIEPEPILPQPVFAPLAAPAAEILWDPPAAIASAAIAVAPKPKPIAPAPVTPAPLRIKSKPPTEFAPRPRKYDPREFSSRFGEPRPSANRSERRPSWKFAAAAAALIITVFAATRAYLPDNAALKAEAQDRPAPVTVAAPPPVITGTIVVQTQPAGARVLLDGSPAGETPLRIVDVAAGRHVLTFVTSTATVKRTVKVEADKTLTLEIPVFSGWVAIFAPVVLEVSEQGRALGTTDQGRLLLPPGRHTLTLTNREFGYSADHAVEIEAGEVRSLNVQPTGTVNLNAVPWAEVWIDGRKAGDTPIANLDLPLGNREIIFRHPELGERKIVTRVTAGAPVAVSVDFSR